jgi:hypothetical protein
MMTRKHFRPLPIDIDKPLPVYHKEIGDDPARAARSVPQLGTGMEPEEEKVCSACTKQISRYLIDQQHILFLFAL